MPERRHPTVHASAVLIGGRAVLIRGASGAGKSVLALSAMGDAAARGLDAALISDDRVVLEALNGRLVARAAPEIAGRAELRGLGLVTVPHEAAGVVGLVVDIVWEQPPRLPDGVDETIVVDGIELPHMVLWAEDPAPVLKLRHGVERVLARV